jgi:hypothetical protein
VQAYCGGARRTSRRSAIAPTGPGSS